jgi:hypothetical protein
MKNPCSVGANKVFFIIVLFDDISFWHGAISEDKIIFLLSFNKQ